MLSNELYRSKVIRDKLKLLILYIDRYGTRKSLDCPIDQNFLVDTVLCQMNEFHICIPDSKHSFLYFSTGFWSMKTASFHKILLSPSQEKMMEAAWSSERWLYGCFLQNVQRHTSGTFGVTAIIGIISMLTFQLFFHLRLGLFSAIRLKFCRISDLYEVCTIDLLAGFGTEDFQLIVPHFRSITINNFECHEFCFMWETKPGLHLFYYSKHWRTTGNLFA